MSWTGRLVMHAALIVVLVLVPGAGLAASPAARPIGLAPDRLAGEWVGMAGCEGIRLDMSLQFEAPDAEGLHASLRADPVPIDERLPKSPLPYVIPLVGAYDADAGTFTLASTESRRPMTVEMKGLVDRDAQRLAVELKSPQWRRCGLAIAGRQKLGKELDRIREESAGVAKKAKKTSKRADKLTQKSDVAELCTPEMSRWLGQLTDLEPQAPASRRPRRRFDPPPRPVWRTGFARERFEAGARRALHDSRFRADLGKRFTDLSWKERALLVAQAGACVKRFPNSLSATTLQKDLSNALLGRPEFPWAGVAAHNLALDALDGWLRNATDRLNTLADSGTPDDINAVNRASTTLWTYVGQEDRDRFNTVLTDARGAAARNAVLAGLEPLLAGPSGSMADLDRLAEAPLTGYTAQQLADRDRARIDARVAEHVNRVAPPVATREIEAASGAEGAHMLAEWRDKHQAVISYLNDENRTKLGDLLRTRFVALVGEIVADERQAFEHNVQSRSGAAALAYAVAYEAGFRKRYTTALDRKRPVPVPEGTRFPDLRVWTEPRFKEFTDERATWRQHALEQDLDELRQIIGRRTTAAGVEQVRKDYLDMNDVDTAAAKTVAEAIETRLDEVAPFRGNRAEEYLQAIYDEDFATLRRLDNEFSEPMAHAFEESEVADLLAGLGSLAQGRQVTRSEAQQAIAKEMKAHSLIYPMWAVYLLRYSFAYRECLDPEPVVFTKTVRNDIIHRNGWGIEMWREQGTPITTTYKVNHRFADIFQDVNAMDYGSPAFLDALLGGHADSELTLGKIESGVRDMMQRYTCDTPLVARMEANMQAYVNKLKAH